MNRIPFSSMIYLYFSVFIIVIYTILECFLEANEKRGWQTDVPWSKAATTKHAKQSFTDRFAVSKDCWYNLVRRDRFCCVLSQFISISKRMFKIFFIFLCCRTSLIYEYLSEFHCDGTGLYLSNEIWNGFTRIPKDKQNKLENP